MEEKHKAEAENKSQESGEKVEIATMGNPLSVVARAYFWDASFGGGSF